MIFQFIEKYRWDLKTDRIGPDIPFTHWRLYFNKLMIALCRKKFKAFPESAVFRAGAYAIGCSKIEIGERVIIRPDCKLFGETTTLMTSIKIEDDVLIACGVHIYINNHRFDNPNIPIINQGHYADKPVILRRGCWIGANVIILPGVEIGENTVVGANSTVTKSFPKGVIIAGNPARFIKVINEV